MPNYPIKLGKKMSEPMTVAVPEKDKDEMHYPTLYLEWDSDYELPDSGTMTVKFRKVSQTTNKSKAGPKQTVSLDITEILDTEADAKAAKEEESGDAALDRLKKESEDEYSEKE